MTDAWISGETEEKERHLRGIVHMHMRMCKGILARTSGPPYLYVDLHAGPGNLEYHGRTFDGSPLVFLDLAGQEQLRYQSLYFDKDETVAARLGRAIAKRLEWPDGLFDLDGYGYATVDPVPCETGMPAWLAANSPHPSRHGLVYSDPIGKEIPYALLRQVAGHLPRVDILSYVSATAYKRRGGTRLADHIAAVGKRHVLIRREATAWQWTFILWTNWDAFPEWERIGFYRLDSERGQRILARLNLTKRELHETTNTPLPFRLGPALPDLRRVPEASPVPGGPGAGVQEGGRDV